MVWNRIRVLIALVLTLSGQACTSSSSSHLPALPAGTTRTGPQGKSQALEVPSTYQQACVHEASICLAHTTGRIPTALKRPLHLPVLRSTGECPASQGHIVNTAAFGGVALGEGPVRAIIADEPAADARRGVADLLNHTSVPGWFAFKTLWFSIPSYAGPIVIRAKRLDGSGPIAMGEGPELAPLVVPAGPVTNEDGGYREAPGGTWLKVPGCYGWQVDGLSFSEVIVFRAVLR